MQYKIGVLSCKEIIILSWNVLLFMGLHIKSQPHNIPHEHWWESETKVFLNNFFFNHQKVFNF